MENCNEITRVTKDANTISNINQLEWKINEQQGHKRLANLRGKLRTVVVSSSTMVTAMTYCILLLLASDHQL